MKISKERKTVHGNNIIKKQKREKFGGTGEFNFTFDNKNINKKLNLQVEEIDVQNFGNNQLSPNFESFSKKSNVNK